MNKTENFIKKLIVFLIGISITHLGVALILKTGIGSDPFTVFSQGLSNVLNKTNLRYTGIVNFIVGEPQVTPGVGNMIIVASLLVIILMVDRKRIKLGTLLCVAVGGPLIDLGVRIIDPFAVETFSLEIRILFVILGCISIAVGFTLVLGSELGVGAQDIVPFLIVDNIAVEYRWVRMTMDAVFLIGGFYMGGIVGVGTIIAMLIQGPLVQFCLPYGRQMVGVIVNESNGSFVMDNPVSVVEGNE